MLPAEQVLLTELRRRGSWIKFGSRLGNLVRTEEARVIARALEALHSANGKSPESVVSRGDLERVSSAYISRDGGKVKAAIGTLGEPLSPPHSYAAVWNLIATQKLLQHHERYLDQARSGRLSPREFDRVIADYEELRALGAQPLGIRPVIELSREISPSRVRYPTGIHSGLDQSIGGGLRPGEVAVIVAPSKHGKTTSLLRIALNLARKRKRVLYLSFEIYLEQIVERLAGLAGSKRRIPRTLYAHWCEAEAHSVEEVIGMARDVGAVDCIMVDYLELLKLDNLDLVNAVGSALLKLRNYARRSSSIVWTASQADDPKTPWQSVLTRPEIYGARRKIHHADLILGSLLIPHRKQLVYSIWGSRHGHMGENFVVEADQVALKFRDL